MRHVRSLLFIFAFSVVAGSAFAGLSVSPGTPAHTHSDANTGGGTLAVSGTVSSTKACATGYVRNGPNFCMRRNNDSALWTDAVACTGTVLGPNALPADAKAAVLKLNWNVLSNNAIAQRSNHIYFFHDVACTAAQEATMSRVEAREFAAVAAGTVLYRVKDVVVVPLPVTNTVYSTMLNAGGNGNADLGAYWVLGYFD